MRLILRSYKRLFLLVVAIVLFTIILVKSYYNQTNKIHPKHIFRKKNENDFIDRGIKVVVGHYIGNPVDKIPNATYDMINTNYFDPIPQAGKNGNPVVTAPKDFVKMKQLFQINRFNLLASDSIPLNRTLPDVRRKRCPQLFSDYLTYPKTTVIIVFHNEAWSTLLRTIWSVINRSPKELLQEIILVDDASQRDFLGRALDEYIKTLPINTVIIRSSSRIGLIKARMLGARKAKGDVLTFLDAHCECTNGWLVSLLSVIKSNRKTVVCPVIDIINDETFAYVKSFELHWGAFNWNLQFRWFTLGSSQLKLRKTDIATPFSSPTMAGGLFAIDREYFFEIGGYDEGMTIWGGENLEMSFRVWQCGGQIKIVPCSHVGHIFRKSSPYSFPGGINKTLYANLARVALVWMDDWGKFYFKFNEVPNSVKHEQNITSRLELRKRLDCKSFEWYLDNIWPEHFFPKKDRFFGHIRNMHLDMCLIKPEKKSISNQPTGIAVLEKCLPDHFTIEMFVMTSDGFIMTDDSVCLDAPEKNVIGLAKVRIMACSGHTRQKWAYNNKTSELRHLTNNKCLDLSPSKEGSEGLILEECNQSISQKWEMKYVPWL